MTNVLYILCSLLSVYTHLSMSWGIFVQVDLTEYVEKHEFVFDAVLDEDVSNDEVSVKYKPPTLSNSYH